MPRKLTAYGCKFSCGQRVTTNKKSMEGHESRCFANPENRACKTCKFNDLSSYDNKYYCSINKGDDKAQINCKFWQLH